MELKKSYENKLEHATQVFLRYARRHGLRFDQGYAHPFGLIGWSRYHGPGKSYAAGAHGIQLEWKTRGDGSDAVSIHVWREEG